jgi:hypothetical protein
VYFPFFFFLFLRLPTFYFLFVLLLFLSLFLSFCLFTSFFICFISFLLSYFLCFFPSILCSFWRLIRRPEHLIGRRWYLPANCRSFIRWLPDQWVSQCYAIEYDRSFYCALFCVFMTRVSQCPISLRAEHSIFVNPSFFFLFRHILATCLLFLGSNMCKISTVMILLRTCL